MGVKIPEEAFKANNTLEEVVRREQTAEQGMVVVMNCKGVFEAIFEEHFMNIAN